MSKGNTGVTVMPEVEQPRKDSKYALNPIINHCQGWQLSSWQKTTKEHSQVNSLIPEL